MVRSVGAAPVCGEKSVQIFGCVIPSRIAPPCRYNHLDPSIKKKGWTDEEDLLLQKAVATVGVSGRGAECVMTVVCTCSLGLVVVVSRYAVDRSIENVSWSIGKCV
jgi:hypothetical protein